MRNSIIVVIILMCVLLNSCVRTNKGKDVSQSGRILVPSTNEDSSQQNQIIEDKKQFEEINNLVIKKHIDDISKEYFDYFGKTVDDILTYFGSDYKVNTVENSDSSGKEGSWYTKTTYYEYEDTSVTVYKTKSGADWIERIYTSRSELQYVGSIKIGSSYQNVIDQLGYPNQLSSYGKPELIYSANNYILFFEIANGKVKSISIAVQL